jgi:hypothetical protein
MRIPKILSFTSFCSFGCQEEAVPSSDTLLSSTGAVLATVSMDYSVGALATIDIETFSLQQNIAAISGDPAVHFDGEYLWQFNRFQYDTLRKYDVTNVRSPLGEISLQFDGNDSVNPQAVVRCADKVFISQYDKPGILVLDPLTMQKIGVVSLTEFNDEDGSPEASSMLVNEEEHLFVGLQRLNRNDSWTGVGSYLVEIDCQTESVVDSWSFGSNIAVYPWKEDSILVRSNQLNESPGGVFSFSKSEPFEPIVTTVTENVMDVAVVDETMIYITIDMDFGQQNLNCLDMQTGDSVVIDEYDEYLTFIRSNGDDFWLGAHWGWNSPEEAEYGIHRLRFSDCEMLSTERLYGELAPVDITFF